MALYSIVNDTTAGLKRAVPYPGFADEVFSGGGTIFSLSHDIDTSHYLDVWVDGVMQNQSAFTIDASANTVTLSESVSALASVRVRIYLH